MTAFETLRTRFLYRPLDAVLTASVRPREPAGVELRRLVHPRSSNYTRVGSLIRAVDRLIPGTARWATRSLLRPDSVPFEKGRVELLAAGSGSTVFLLGSSGERYVVKVYRRTLGRVPAKLVELAAEYREKYDTVRSWYAGEVEPALVHPAWFLALDGPLLGRPAVACVQRYIEGERRDLLRGFEDGVLLDIFRKDRRLRGQFTRFARQTLRLRARSAVCVDLLGAENLMVVQKGDSRALKLIDYGIFELTSLETRSPAIFSRIESVLSRLETLLTSVEALSE